MQLVVSPAAPPVKQGRRRLPKQPKQPTADTCVREVRTSERVKAAQSSPPTPLTTIRPEMAEGKSDSAITKHIHLSPDCLQSVCSNVLSPFSFVAMAHSKSHLNILEAVFIARLKPELCLQKEFVRSLCLF